MSGTGGLQSGHGRFSLPHVPSHSLQYCGMGPPQVAVPSGASTLPWSTPYFSALGVSLWLPSLLGSIFYYLLNTLSQRCHQAWLVGSSVLWSESIAEPAGPSCFQHRTASDLFLQKPPLQFLHPLYENFTTCTQYSRIWNLSLANNSHLLQYKLYSSWRLHLCGRMC